MANPDHLKVLKKGIKAWNTWRRTLDWRIDPDLSNANLKKFDFGDANLYGVNFTGANLAGAWLHNAPDLTCADLSGANLTGVKLYKVSCSGGRFAATNFNGAELIIVDFIGADLRG